MNFWSLLCTSWKLRVKSSFGIAWTTLVTWLWICSTTFGCHREAVFDPQRNSSSRSSTTFTGSFSWRRLSVRATDASLNRRAIFGYNHSNHVTKALHETWKRTSFSVFKNWSIIAKSVMQKTDITAKEYRALFLI